MKFRSGTNKIYIFIIILVSLVCCALIVWLSVSLTNKKKTLNEPTEHIHSYDDWVIVKNPTCVDSGSRERYCSCGARQESIIAALNHDLISVEEKPATCTDIGHKEYIRCTRCDYDTYEEIGALGHNFGEWETVTAATCFSLGLEQRFCLHDENHVETREIEKAEHSMSDWVITKRASCLEDGEKNRICSVCHIEETQPVNATGHSFGEWEIVKESTCTSDGLKKRICKNDETHTESEIIESVGHIPDDWVIEKDASCTEDGLKYSYCSICAVLLDECVIDKLGHSPSDWKVESEPTCELAGSRYKECNSCNERLEIEKLDATGHTLKFLYDDVNHFYQCVACLTVKDRALHEWDDNACEICDYDAGGIKGLDWTVSADGEYYAFNGFGSVEQADEFAIPEVHNGKKVTAIGKDAFRSFTGKIITIPSFITIIPYAAFYGCNNLEKLVIPFIGTRMNAPSNFGYLFGSDSIEDNGSYIPSSLTAVQISDGIIQLNDEAFKNCTSVKNIIMPDTIVTLGEDCFYGCTSLEEIVLPANLKIIGSCAFYNCSSLTRIEIPESVEEIGRCAFECVAENCKIIFLNTEDWFLYDGSEIADKIDEKYLSEDDEVTILALNRKYTFKRKTTEGE